MKKIYLSFVCVVALLNFDKIYGESRSLTSPVREKSPYYILQKDGKISGLDAEIVGLLFLETAGLDPATYDSTTSMWEDALRQVEMGKKDFVANATKTPGREKWGIFSDPYRMEEHVILMPKDKDASFDSAASFIKYAKSSNLKIAVVKGVKYNSKELNAFLDSMPGMLIFEKSFEDAVQDVVSKKADVAVVEEVNALYTLGNQNQAEGYKVIKIGASEPQRLLFSRKTIRPALVDLINETIKTSADKIKVLFDNYTTKDNPSNWLLPEGKTTLFDAPMMPEVKPSMPTPEPAPAPAPVVPTPAPEVKPVEAAPVTPTPEPAPAPEPVVVIDATDSSSSNLFSHLVPIETVGRYVGN